MECLLRGPENNIEKVLWPVLQRNVHRGIGTRFAKLQIQLLTGPKSRSRKPAVDWSPQRELCFVISQNAV
jgi:hypothetical protein